MRPHLNNWQICANITFRHVLACFLLLSTRAIGQWVRTAGQDSCVPSPTHSLNLLNILWFQLPTLRAIVGALDLPCALHPKIRWSLPALSASASAPASASASLTATNTRTCHALLFDGDNKARAFQGQKHVVGHQQKQRVPTL